MAQGSVVIEVKDRGWDALRRRLEAATGGIYGKAGVIGEKASEAHQTDDAAMTNVELALIHEFGLGVPERSFIRAAFDQNREKYLEHLQKFVAAVYERKLSIEVALGLLAEEVASDIRQLVLEGAGIPPPNSPATVAEKGSSRPLVDTKQMVGAVSSQVVRGGTP